MVLIRLYILLMACATGNLVDSSSHGKGCKQILKFQRTAPSGVYHIMAGTHIIEVYCEMGLNGGGYTFLSPKSLAEISNADLQSLISDRKSLLMKIRQCDGTHPYTVLEQLPQHASVPISYMLSSFAGYQPPVNAALLGSPYLYAGFLPKSIEPVTPVQGIKANGVSHTYTNCGTGANGYMALFPNFGEKTPSNYSFSDNWPFCNAIFNGALPNPSTRVMPPDYFMFAEFHFGGCGCYTQTDSRLRSLLGYHIGFR